jgi:uncharacterized protein (TIGR02145 family)
MNNNNLILKFLVLTVILYSTSGYAQTVTIGSQVWASKNLNVSTYRNGEIIPHVQDQNAWAKLTTGAWCYYDNDPSNEAKYGKLYNWYAVNDPRGLAPVGFHIPTHEEWLTLTDYLGGEALAGGKMKSENGWNNYNTKSSKICPNCESWNLKYRKEVKCQTCKDSRSVSIPSTLKPGNGTNSSGFSGLPGGSRYENGTFNKDYTLDVGEFYKDGNWGSWWSSSSFSSQSRDEGLTWTSYATSFSLFYSSTDFSRQDEIAKKGISVRCLRD